jgi:hypothetical protein
MADIFKRQKAQEEEGEARRIMEREQQEKERVRLQEIEFERAIQNYVKTTVAGK